MYPKGHIRKANMPLFFDILKIKFSNKKHPNFTQCVFKNFLIEII